MVLLRDVPRSGNWFIDWVFKEYALVLRKKTTRIKRKKGLLDPERGNAVAGLTKINKSKVEITINSDREANTSRNAEVKTLIHELGHVVFWARERNIRQLEKRLFKEGFTKEQKNFLKSFLPKYEVK